jgi:hypothetical protein
MKFRAIIMGTAGAIGSIVVAVPAHASHARDCANMEALLAHPGPLAAAGISEAQFQMQMLRAGCL